MNNFNYLKNNRIRYWISIISNLLLLLPKKKKKLPTDIKKILIIKPDHLGDLLWLSGIVVILRKEFPNAQICGLFQSQSQKLNNYLPKLDKVYFCDVPQLDRNSKSIKKYLRFLKQLISDIPSIRKENFDISLTLRYNSGNLLTLLPLLNIKYKLGYSSVGFSYFLNKSINANFNVHQIDNFLNIINLITKTQYTKSDIKPIFTANIKDISKAKDVVLSLGSKYIVIHPGSDNRVKLLQNSMWINIIKLLEAKNIPVILIGTSKEAQIIEIIKTDKTAEVIDESIGVMYELMSNSILNIAIDSLPGHIAALTKTQSLIFYKFSPEQFGPIGVNNIVITTKNMNQVYTKISECLEC